MSVCFLLGIVVGLWLEVQADVCVLEPMVTLRHPSCSPPTNCTGNHWYNYDDDDEDEATTVSPENDPLPKLQLGTSAFAHFQSVRSGDTLSFREYRIANSITELEALNISVGTAFTCANMSCEAGCKYRSYDGSNNNLNNTDWGQTNTAMLRFLVPRYNGPGGQVNT